MNELIPKVSPAKVLLSATFLSGEQNSANLYHSDKKFRAELSSGPENTWIGPANTGISGPHTLKVTGFIENGGKYSITLFKGLEIPVSADTTLKYHIFPAMGGNHYDFQYTQMYFGMDLIFTDGTKLSELSAVDQNGVGISPVAQGESRILFTHQWNQVIVKVGKFAEGKVIEKIVLKYEKPTGNGRFLTYFDDLSLYDQADTVYTRPCHYINILRGTNDSPAFSRGLTAPAVLLPQGFNMYAPCTNHGGNKHYDYLAHTMDSISISHEPSIWIGDRGTWQFMINTSRDAAVDDSFSTHEQHNFFSHDDEIALAHYYSVAFHSNGGDASNSRLEITPTNHGVCARFTYNKEDYSHSILFDSQNADGRVSFGSDGSFIAYSEHKSNGSGRVYIYGKFSELPKATAINGKYAIASFEGSVVTMKFATSYISYTQAEKNYELELEGRTFEEICSDAADAWDDILSHVTDIKGASEVQLENIYSGLYYLYKYPNTIAENAGTKENPVLKYRSPYTKKVEDGEMYINNGFWDTYRTVWAGYTLLTPEKMPRLLNGFVQHYKDSGLVPRWSAPGGVNCMVGTSSDVIFADAAVKGIDFDLKNAYESAVKNACVYSPEPKDGGRELLDRSIFLGYTPGHHEDFSWSIEGYINDFGIAQMAKILGESATDPKEKEKYAADYAYFINRAKNYTLLFWDNGEGVKNKWFRGREADGRWTRANMHHDKFDPLFWGNDFTETDAYNMSVSVPFDGKGLANLYGGKDALAKKIDSIFETYDVYRGYGATGDTDGIHEQREAREMKLGRYGQSNQPSHHIIYMYNHTSEPWKAQKYSRDVTRRLFVGGKFGQGIPGDEDNGEMSTWYLFSALGFYPLSIGSGEYAIGSPLFEEITLNYAGHSLHIVAKNNSLENIYVQSVTLNGEQLDRTFITHEEIRNGGELIFEMGPKPSDFGSVAPTSLTTGDAPAAPLVDLVSPTVKVVPAVKETTEAVEEDTVYTTVAGIAATCDNTSKTDARIPAGTKVTYSFKDAKSVGILTLTSSIDPETLSKVTLYAAVNGGQWVKLNDYNNIVFKWQQETIPFLTGSEESYNHFMLEFTDSCAIAQIELLGR
ncbi:MAG: GH92 family glycosyl hydrolase [Eubacteriales bacterium]